MENFIFCAVFRLITCEEFSQKWNLHGETENRKTFHFRLLPAHSNNKTLRKLKHSKTQRTQKLHFGSILGTFAHFMPEHFWKIHLRKFLFFNFYRCAKFQKKVRNRFQEKLVTDKRTYGRTDKHEFIGPPLQGVQKNVRATSRICLKFKVKSNYVVVVPLWLILKQFKSLSRQTAGIR